MQNVRATAAAAIFLGLVGLVGAEEPESPLGKLEKKLHGAWYGQSACQGDLLLRADGTYEKTNCGPGGENFSGTWAVRWEGLPPILILICKIADDPMAVGKKEEVKLVQLDDNSVEIRYPQTDFVWQYARKKK